ncbi:hypothetical protein ELE36_12915 [Pseudolysobacter antarcticus]|uniref:Uncharacterized protein n=1 Tax=Pseudolysobacter antarcticus TaxID=2511995 RepID=A0A411HL07_9GAMM|nr:hypothetical protein [Pseudolysobacter antarcticus]QBB71181.1 hypothetical protein ELE36_12915 [Pseudolysobacter antarcticus]
MRSHREAGYAETIEIDRVGIHVVVEIRRAENRGAMRDTIGLHNIVHQHLKLRPTRGCAATGTAGGTRYTMHFIDCLPGRAGDDAVLVIAVKQIGKNDDRLSLGEMHARTRTLEFDLVRER